MLSSLASLQTGCCFSCWQLEETLRAVLNLGEDATGLCALTQVMRHLNVSTQSARGKRNGLPAFYYLEISFNRQFSFSSSVRMYGAKFKEKQIVFCIAVVSDFLLCSQFVKLLILSYEQGYLNKASIGYARCKGLIFFLWLNDHFT